jgi:hypothetical protein
VVFCLSRTSTDQPPILFVKSSAGRLRTLSNSTTSSVAPPDSAIGIGDTSHSRCSGAHCCSAYRASC